MSAALTTVPVVCVSLQVTAQAPDQAGSSIASAVSMSAAGEPATFRYNNRTITVLRATVFSRPPEERARVAADLLDSLIRDRTQGPVTTRPLAGTMIVSVGARDIFAIFPLDLDQLAGDAGEQGGPDRGTPSAGGRRGCRAENAVASGARDGAGARRNLPATVSIGYDIPWRQVQALLLIAAERTSGVRAEPKPVVRQSALADSYVVYTLLVCLEDPHMRVQVLDALHANIQDAFNEYGVQIVSPNYEGDPDERKVVRPEQWYAAPARPSPAGEPVRRATDVAHRQ